MKCLNCKEKDAIKYSKYSNGKFCSRECARGYSTKTNRDSISKKVSITMGGDGVLKQKCIICGEKLKKNSKKYCSNNCRAIAHTEKVFKEYEDKQVFPSKFSARRYLLEKHNNKCMICGIEEWNGEPVPVVMDHINGNSDDHSFKNCRIICRNCDGLLPTYCGGNKGNGGSRSRRRLENYHKGKKKW